MRRFLVAVGKGAEAVMVFVFVVGASLIGIDANR